VCTLRPQTAGMSENIRVISVIGRFLEHSRILYFRNGAENPLDGDFFLSSADWMDRNLLQRVECAVPVLDRVLKERLWDLLQFSLKDKRQAWDMQPDGTYIQRQPTNEDEKLGTHAHLMKAALRSPIR
jgi:polyphosphate kinase